MGPRAEDPSEGWCLVCCCGEFLALFVPLVIGAYKQLLRDFSGTFYITVSFFSVTSGFFFCVLIPLVPVRAYSQIPLQRHPDLEPVKIPVIQYCDMRVPPPLMWRLELRETYSGAISAFVLQHTAGWCHYADHAVSDIESSVSAVRH